MVLATYVTHWADEICNFRLVLTMLKFAQAQTYTDLLRYVSLSKLSCDRTLLLHGSKCYVVWGHDCCCLRHNEFTSYDRFKYYLHTIHIGKCSTKYLRI